MGLKQHNFVIFLYISFSTKLCGKNVFYYLTVSVLNFMQKSARIAEISAKVTGGYFFMFTLYIPAVSPLTVFKPLWALRLQTTASNLVSSDP